MELNAFDFSKNISRQEIMNHVRYYYTTANIAMRIMENSKKDAMEIYKEIRKNLNTEYKEYDKVKNREYIRKNKLYAQYVDNLTNACVKPTYVTSYNHLSSNLYDVQDYIDYGFGDFLEINDENIFDLNNPDIYMGKLCKILTKDYLVYEGKVNIALYDIPNGNNSKIESISIYDFNKWNQVSIDNIKSIKIIEGKQ